MPRITTYEAPDSLGLRPTEVGISATAAAARRVGAEYSEAAAATEKVGHAVGSAIQVAGDVAVKYIDHQQISHGANTLANLINAKSKQWDDVAKKADPNDPTVAQKFLTENLEPDLEKFKSGFVTENGQRWAESRADQFRQHMFAKTTADMATMAGQAAVINSRQTINGLSNTVRGDPSSLDFSLKTLEGATDALVATSPNLTGTAANKVRTDLLQRGKEEIIKSAAMGYIEKTGEVPPWASDPKYSPYINGTELKQFAQAARYYSRLGESEGRAARAANEHAAKVDFNGKVNELEASIMPTKIGERASLPPDYWDKLRALAQHPGAALEPGRLKTMVTQGEIITERLNKPEPLARVSHDTTMRIMGGLRDPNRDRNTMSDEIWTAYQKGDLNNADFTFLNRELEARRTPEGLALGQDRTAFWKRYGSVVDPSFGATPLGSQQLYFAEMDARRQEEVLKKKGLDPHLVYDPRSEYFFGNPKNIARYQKPLDELMRDQRAGQAAQPEAPKAFVPPPNWQWSASRRQYRDPAGQIYDASGNPVKP